MALASSFSNAANPKFLEQSLVLYNRGMEPRTLLFTFAYATDSIETFTVNVHLQDPELNTAKLISHLFYQILWRHKDRVRGSNIMLPPPLQEHYRNPKKLTDLIPPYSGQKKVSDFNNKPYYSIYEDLSADHPISQVASQTCEVCLQFLASIV